MRDLSVYYCSQCGFYAYYQLPKNAICHRCDIAMTLIEMRYQDFMNLDYEQRDKLISDQIISSSTPYIQKICKTGRSSQSKRNRWMPDSGSHQT